ncbi:hypothetical protein HHI36_019690 [Cryptolaemus montrouzieri]|uniref:Uncharacterized protein n=1 Tax=Cryptolaemus montrouzieri TaxID=559131 RepID=A0ABD2N988_9CUCU
MNEDSDNTDNSNEVANEKPYISLRKKICPTRLSKEQQQKKKKIEEDSDNFNEEMMKWKNKLNQHKMKRVKRKLFDDDTMDDSKRSKMEDKNDKINKPKRKESCLLMYQ